VLRYLVGQGLERVFLVIKFYVVMLEYEANNEEKIFLLKAGYNKMNATLKISSAHFIL